MLALPLRCFFKVIFSSQGLRCSSANVSSNISRLALCVSLSYTCWKYQSVCYCFYVLCSISLPARFQFTTEPRTSHSSRCETPRRICLNEQCNMARSWHTRTMSVIFWDVHSNLSVVCCFFFYSCDLNSIPTVFTYTSNYA
jgi:hypothetical protein